MAIEDEDEKMREFKFSAEQVTIRIPFQFSLGRKYNIVIVKDGFVSSCDS